MSPEQTALLAAREAELGCADTVATHETIAPASNVRSGDLQRTVSDLPHISLDSGLTGPPSRSAAGAVRDYTVLGILGEGGMGVVRLARQRSLDRDVALKTLKPEASSSVQQALLEEARTTGALEHPGVIPIHALGSDEAGRPMLVMKRVDGVHLGALLRDPSHPAWSTLGADDRGVASVEILMQVCRTLELAHSRGIIHRDIKPENIMVGAFGEVYVLDWGIAISKVASAEAQKRPLAGTPLYMAPEMVEGAAVDERTDVYLLGATLHHILVGRPRHEGATMTAVLSSALLSTPTRYGEGVPEVLASLANAATARDPSARPGSVAAFRARLADYLRHKSARLLSEAAFARLAEVELAMREPGLPPDLTKTYRLLTEARFGLTQSLQTHGDDPDAQRGMRRCVAAAITLELRQGHVETAEAMLAELEPPDPELAASVESGRARAAADAVERARLETLDREHDPRQHVSVRRWPLYALAGLVLATGGVAHRVGLRETPSAPTMVAFAGAVFVVLASVLIGLRRAFATNAFNKRLSLLLLVVVGAVVAHRVLGWRSGSPVPSMLAVDLLIIAAVCAGGAVTISRQLAVASAVSLSGAVAMLVFPELSHPIFLGACVAASIATAVALPTEKS